MTDTKHTPTTLRIDLSQSIAFSKAKLIDENGSIAAWCPGAGSLHKKRAEFICTAVNSYSQSRAIIAALTEALEEVDDYLDNRADVDDGIPNTAMELLTTVRAAMALAKGE